MKTKNIFIFFSLSIAFLFLSGCGNLQQQALNQATPSANNTQTNVNTSYCAADKYCQIIYIKATEKDLCEPCPPDYSSNDYICGTIKDYDKYIHDKDFDISCEMCGNKPWEEVECKCIDNKCKKFIIKK